MTIYQIISLFLALVATTYYVRGLIKPNAVLSRLNAMVWCATLLNAIVAFVGLK